MKNILIILVLTLPGAALGMEDSEPMKMALHEDAAETAQSEMIANRPDEDKGPTKVHYLVFMVDIDNINAAGQSFTINAYLSLKWKDPRLAHIGDERIMPLNDVWHPRVIIANRSGSLVQKSLPEIVQVNCDGTVIYRQRYTGPMSQPLTLSEFPFDEQKFTMHFVSAGYDPDEIEFIPDIIDKDQPKPGGVLYHDLSLPDWEVVDYNSEARYYKPFEQVQSPGFVFEFTAERFGMYYVWKVIMPLVFIVVMSWGAFYIDPSNAGAQIGVSTSSMLTLIAYRFMLGNLIPKLPYMTRLDYFILGSTAIVFLSLIEVIVTTNLEHNGKRDLALKIDLWCRPMYPIVFALWIIESLVI